MTSRTSRACESCRVRKVRCVGEWPCNPCRQFKLACTFRPSGSRPRRQHGARGRLVEQLRRSQETPDGVIVGSSPGGDDELIVPVSRQQPQQQHYTLPSSSSPSPQNAPYQSLSPGSGLGQAGAGGEGMAGRQAMLPASPAPGSSLGPTYGEDFFLSLLPSYEQTTYPVNPIIAVNELVDAINVMQTDPGKAALVYATAAVTLNLGYPRWLRRDGEMAARVQDLTARSVAARRRATGVLERTDDVAFFSSGGKSHMMRSVDLVMTFMFNEITYLTFNKSDLAFLSLRDAIALIQLLVDDRPSSSCPRQNRNNAGQGDGGRGEVETEHEHGKDNASTPPADRERARLQRLYWEGFIHERYQTVITMHPFVLSAPRFGLPQPDSTIPPHVQRGYTRLIRLFSVIDDDFLAYWREEDRGENPRLRPLAVAWVEQKQAQLDGDDLDDLDDAADGGHETVVALTELQQADLIVTRAWLRTLVWQMAMTRCLLASDGARPTHVSEALSLAFPARRLSAQLRVLLGSVAAPGRSIAMHGAGILRKLFEVINTVADVMALVPDAATWEEAEAEAEHGSDGGGGGGARMEDFCYLVGVFMCLERVDEVLRGIIRAKVDGLRRVFPGLEVEGMDDPGW